LFEIKLIHKVSPLLTVNTPKLKMAIVRHLDNAPITEAIIDIRAKIPSKFQVESFLNLKKTIGDRFPKIEDRKLFSSEFGIKEGRIQPPSSRDHGVHGYFFRSEAEPKIVQFRVDGFTFSLLKPYTNWEVMVSEARELWGYYRDIAQPEATNRLAVRYINHINIPLPVDELSLYFTAPPRIPEGVNGAIAGFLSKVIVYDQGLDIATNIVQALEKSTRPEKHITIILDVDSFKMGDFNVSSDDKWDVFETLHTVKNQVFFNSITEKTARLFE